MKAKRLIAMLLALAMMLSLAVAAFADNPTTDPNTEEDEAPTTGSITITNAVAGEKYTIYQLFEAKIDEGHPSNGKYPISYQINKKSPVDPDEDNPVYTLITTDEVLKDAFELKPTEDENVFVVTYVGENKTHLSDDEVAAFMTLTDDDLKLLRSYDEEAEDDTVVFDEIEFGYYMIRTAGDPLKAGDDPKVIMATNSTNPDAEIELKAYRKPSNPDKVEDTTKAVDAGKIHYNSSVKAVNYQVNEQGTSNLVLNYFMIDTPDYDADKGIKNPGNDAQYVNMISVKVYDALVLKEKGLLNEDGTIVVNEETGLYDLSSVTPYATINKFAGEHYKQNEETKAYELVWEADEEGNYDYGYYNKMDAAGNTDWYTTVIPWATAPKADGSREPLYPTTSYIVFDYEQFINENINEIDENDQFDGTYVNRVDYKYGTKSASEVDIGNDKVAAYSTGLSLRKHPTTKKNDDDVLEGAVYIAYKTEVKDSKTLYYSYHEYSEDEYSKLVDDQKKDFIKEYKEEHENAEPTAFEIADYMGKNPISNTAWLLEEGEVDPTDFTTFENATHLTADNSYKTVEIKNLYDDVFYLQEIVAPYGYDCPKVPYKVTVTPVESDSEKSQDHFTITIDKNGHSELPQAYAEKNGNNFYTAQLHDGTASVLPTTGGAGTVALIGCGTLLFAAAGVVLVTKKRMYNEGK